MLYASLRGNIRQYPAISGYAGERLFFCRVLPPNYPLIATFAAQPSALEEAALSGPAPYLAINNQQSTLNIFY